jgi:hypothetical protein
MTDPTLPILQRLKALETMIQTLSSPLGTPLGTPATTSNDPINTLERFITVVQKAGVPQQNVTATVPVAPNIDQLKQIIDPITKLFGTDARQPLGQMNGALGQTIGSLLDGKKTALAR